MSIEPPTIKEMYDSSKLPLHTEYNKSYYDPLTDHFDHLKHKDENVQFKYNTYKKKRPKTSKLAAKFDRAPKCQELLAIKKHSEKVPAPWSYELGIKWMVGYKGKGVERTGALVGTEDREGTDKRLFKKWKHAGPSNPEKEDLNDGSVRKIAKGFGKKEMDVKKCSIFSKSLERQKYLHRPDLQGKLQERVSKAWARGSLFVNETYQKA